MNVNPVFNCYHYPEKPALEKNLDALSSPLRKAFGGRDITLETGSISDPLHKVARIALIALSILTFPIGLIATAALAAKKISFMRDFEKQKKELQNHCDKLEYNKVSELLQKHPILLQEANPEVHIYKIFLQDKKTPLETSADIIAPIQQPKKRPSSFIPFTSINATPITSTILYSLPLSKAAMTAPTTKRKMVFSIHSS